MNKKLKKAFTIVELVIVIAVIAVLAAVLIPTFVNVVGNAHNAADKANVRSMNQALILNEAEYEKPIVPKDAMGVLIAAGFNVDSYNDLESGNVFYWDSTENRVLVYSKGKVIYPDELVAKYSNISEISSDWYGLSSEYGVVKFGSESGENIYDVISQLNEGEILKLVDDITIKYISDLMPFNAISVEIDLNGYQLTATQLNDSLLVKDGQELILRNGSLICTANNSNPSLSVYSGGSLTLENVDYSTGGCGIFPAGTANVNVINSTIRGGVYCIATNAETSAFYDVVINVKDSQLISSSSDYDNCAAMINIPGMLIMENCSVTGQRQTVIVRAGTAIIKNCTLTCTGEFVEYASSGTDLRDGSWSNGNEVASGVLIVGNKNNGGYVSDASVSLLGNNTLSLGLVSKNASALNVIYIVGGFQYNGRRQNSYLTYTASNFTVQNSNTLISTVNVGIAKTSSGGDDANTFIDSEDGRNYRYVYISDDGNKTDIPYVNFSV